MANIFDQKYQYKLLQYSIFDKYFAGWHIENVSAWIFINFCIVAYDFYRLAPFQN